MSSFFKHNPHPPLSDGGRGVKILVVCSSNPIVKSIEAVLGGMKLASEVRTVSTPADCESELSAFKPDLLLCHQKESGPSAIGIITLARSSSDYVPVIIVAGKFSAEDVLQCMKAGADDFLPEDKPDLLSGSLTEALGKRRKYNERAHAEQQLRLNESLYRTLTEAGQDMIFVITQDRRIQYVNNIAAQQLGKKPEELVGQSQQEFFSPPIADRQWKNLQRVFLHGEPLYIEDHTDFPGKNSWLSSWLVPLRNSEGLVYAVMGVSRDISDRKATEKDLASTQQRYRAIFENTGTAMLILNSKGMVTLCNSEFESLSGYKKEEIIGVKHWTELTASSDHSRIQTYFDRRTVDPANAPRNYDLDLLRKGGAIRHVLLTAALMPDSSDRIASLQDITDREHMAKALSQERDLLHSLMDHSPDKIYFKDIKGRFIRVNRAVALAHHLEDPKDMLGKTDHDFFEAEFAQTCFNEEQQIIQTGQSLACKVSKEIWADGRTVWISTIKSPLRNREGRIIGTFGISRDISIQQETEAALKRRVEYENLTATISTDFANQTSQDFDKAINRSLAAIGRHTRADRAYLFLFVRNGHTLDNTHEWCEEGVTPHISHLKELPENAFPELRKKLSTHEIVKINRVAEIPPEAAAERQECERESIQSIVCAPIFSDGFLAGFIGLDSVRSEREWEDDVVALLKFTGDVFASALKRKWTEEELTQERDLLHTLMDNIPDYIFFKDTECRYTRANRALAQRLGFNDPSELEGRTDFDFLTGEYAKRTFADEKEIMRTGQPIVGRERQRFWADGSVNWGSTTKMPMRNKAGKIIGTFGISRDITERKQAEMALRRRHEFENLIAAISTDFINLPTQGIDHSIQDSLGSVGRFASCDRCFIFLIDGEKKLMREAYEWRDQGVSSQRERFQDIDTTATPWFMQKMKNLEPVSILNPGDWPEEAGGQEKQILMADGVQSAVCVPLLYGGGLVGFLGINSSREEKKWTNDIVALLKFVGEVFISALGRKWVEDTLTQERNLLRALMDNVPDCIYFKDLEGRFIRANRALALRHGYSDPNQVVGKCDHDTFSPEHADQSLADEKEVILTGNPIIAKEEKEMWPDGRVSWSSTTKMPMRDNAGKIIGTFGISRDITERKQAAEALLHSQKLESLGVLAGGIAHDFNNLLAVVLGNTELALRKLPADAPPANYLSQVKIASQRGAELCKQMLSYAGKGHTSIQIIDLNALVREMAQLLHVSVAKSVSLQYELQDHLPAIRADASQIRQVVMNLVINASEAIGEKTGGITLSTGIMNATQSYLKGTFIESDVPEGDYVYLDVADTGCGMDPATFRRIFDPFFTTKFTGRGLGLAAVLGIVQTHKAALKVKSAKGQGTTFRLLLPNAGGPAGPIAGGSISESQWRGSGAVLIVDDEASVRTVAAGMMEMLGFTAHTAASGEEGLLIFKKIEADTVLAVLDMTMPGMSGSETMAALRKIRPNLKVLLISGYSEQEASKHFTKQGLTSFLQKPFRLAELRDKIRDAIENKP
ncbi:MAG: PAS domain S-box protein [Verrucomicrobiae bacterium]|nr:PAS domain S-box protein [Verrucomicrobiae bacterium]